jgi:hypothetical protein
MVAATAIEPARGDVLDRRYRLVARLGRGGFGDVWRAEELLPDGAPFREVALKLLSSGFTDAADWGEEAKLLASFRHPSLVTIYAAGLLEDAGHLGAAGPVPFVAMELLEGETLADRARAEGRIAWRRVLGWARDAAAALDVIHARGVVHLDLKPANLFLDASGVVKVLDFGIARRAGAPPAVAERALCTVPEIDVNAQTALFVSDGEAFAATRRSGSSRAVVGTPGFIAPEVLDLGEPTAATDAYALAVCIVYLATGRLPQAVPDEPPGQDAGAVSAWWGELRSATVRGDLRDLAADPARLPAGVVRLLLRLLAVDPVERRVEAGGLRALVDEVCERPFGPPAPPYPGLAPLGAEAEGALFGRDDDVERLGRELAYEPCVVLTGGRGSGKTSLALAGIVPRLARRGADGKDDWRAVRYAPGDDPDAALREALAAIEPGLAEASFEAIEAFAGAARTGLVLFVDPLEELFAAPEARRARAAAPRGALAGPRARRPGLRLLCTFCDEEGRGLLDAGSLGAALRASLRFVGPPAKAAVRDVVAGPARLSGAEVVGLDAVAADVQRELGGEGVRLPFVALALAAWWGARERGEGGRVVLRADAWRGLGGIAGALAAHADRVLAGLPAPARALAEALLLRLGTTEGAPLRWLEADLATAIGARPDELSDVLARLAEAHLVRRRDAEVAIAHELLLTGWAYLASKRLADMDRLAFLERLREAAIAWDRSGGHPDLLWRGASLAELAGRRAWLAEGLSPRERDFVRESRRLARRRVALRAAAGGIVVGLVAGAFAASAIMDSREHAAMRERDAARRRAHVAELSAASHRTEDPFHQVAFAGAAMSAQAEAGLPADGTLALDLAHAAAHLPRARFLTLEPAAGPSFPWGERWLVAPSAGGLTVVDLAPPDPEVIEAPDLDADLEALQRPAKEPRTLALAFGAPLVEHVPFAFDTALATRSATGEVRVLRLRENGTVALAGVAPVRCRGALHVASAAPVIACAGEGAVVRWDLARARADAGRSVDRLPGTGDVLDVSPDGALVAVARGTHVISWAASSGRAVDVVLRAPPVAGRFGPRESALALVEPGRVEVVDPERGTPLVDLALDGAPVDARWDGGGLDLAVCDAHGRGRWHYLRAGGRAKDDPPPAGPACGVATPPTGARPLRGAADVPELEGRDIGPHPVAGGFRLSDGRVVTHDLVLVDAAAPAAAAGLLGFVGRGELGREDRRGALDAVSAVVRDSADSVAFQVGPEVRVYDVPTARRVLARAGNLVRRCADGRLLAWQRAGASWSLFDVRSSGPTSTLPREPALIVGADAACRVLYTQRLDGTLLATPIADGAIGRPLARADGYVYEARPFEARGGRSSGLLLALGSGAIARIDDAVGAVTRLGYASPRATALGPGPAPGDVVYADETGVVLLDGGGAGARLCEASPTVPWDDLSTAPDGASVLLLSAERLAVVDVARRELVGSIPLEGRSRFSPWDAEGSVLAWSFDRVGGAEGDVVPRGLALAEAVADAVSNLRVRDGKLALR